jgi:hypothetical protein
VDYARLIEGKIASGTAQADHKVEPLTPRPTRPAAPAAIKLQQ